MTGTRASAECAGSLPRSVSTMGRSPATSAGHSSGKNKFQWNQNIIEQTICSLNKLFCPGEFLTSSQSSVDAIDS